jgi:hypothetical protein
MVLNPHGRGESTDGLETPRLLGKPAPCVRAVVAAVDEAMRARQPHGGLSTRQQSWRAFCLTAVVVTHAMCGARCARASLGTSSRAALAWMVRPSQLPWDALRVASVRGMRRYHGITSGPRRIADTDHAPSKAAQALAHLSTWRAKDSGGSVWGHRLVLVPPTISLPVGVGFSQPAPARRAWYTQAKGRKQQGGPPTQRPPQPTPHAPYPPQQPRARRGRAAFQAHHRALRVPGSAAEALYGTGACVKEASALCEGGQVLAHSRRHPHLRVGQRPQPVADYVAPHPGTPHTIRIRGGAERVALVGRARLDVCAHKTQRCIVALTYAEEERSRSLIASNLRWRTLDSVQGHSLRGLVEVFRQD